MRPLLIFVWVLFVVTASAQLTAFDAQQNINTLSNATKNVNVWVRTFDASQKGILGTPYLNDDWQTGWLESINGRRYDSLDLLLDLQIGEIFVRKEGLMRPVSSEQVKRLGFKDLSGERVFAFFTEKETDEFFWGEVLVDGHTQLIKRSKKYLQRADRQNFAYGVRNNSEYLYEKSRWYLYRSEDSSLVEIALKQQPILNILADHTAELKKFIREKEIFVKKEDELSWLLAYYNELKNEK